MIYGVVPVYQVEREKKTKTNQAHSSRIVLLFSFFSRG